MSVLQNTAVDSFERLVLDGLQASLSELPDVRALQMAPAGRDRGVDLVAQAEVDGNQVWLLIQANRGGFPRDVRDAARRVKLAAARHVPAAVPVLAAPALSPGSRALLREEGVSYWDSGGSLYLRLPQALFFVDRPPPKAEPRRVRAVYRGRSAQVLHALLLDPDRWWGVRKLAAHAAVSPYTVHHVFTFLEEQAWSEKRGAGSDVTRRLADPGPLLDAWAEAHSLRDYTPQRLHAWAQSPEALIKLVGRTLEAADIEHAFTLTAGATLVAPFGTAPLPVAVLVPAGVALDRAIANTDLRPAEEGETVVLYATRDRSPLLFRRRVHDHWVASDVQLYLDLWAFPKRGREQAQHLRASRLQY